MAIPYCNRAGLHVWYTAFLLLYRAAVIIYLELLLQKCRFGRFKMKIYHKGFFLCGILFLLPLPLFALGVMEADLWQWFLSIGLSAKFLFAGLSKREAQRQSNIENNYQRVSRERFGKYAWMKTNLPWLIAGFFFIAALLIRCLFDVVIPVWVAVCFVIALTISVFYSLGLNRDIVEHIEMLSDHEPNR